MTRIEALDEPLDHAALARGVGSFDDDDDAALGILESMLQFEEAQVSGAQFVAVFFRGVRFRLIEVGEANRLAGGGDGHGFFYRESRYGARSGGEKKNPAGCESAAGSRGGKRIRRRRPARPSSCAF